MLISCSRKMWRGSAIVWLTCTPISARYSTFLMFLLYLDSWTYHSEYHSVLFSVYSFFFFFQPLLDIGLYIFKLTTAIGAQVRTFLCSSFKTWPHFKQWPGVFIAVPRALPVWWLICWSQASSWQGWGDLLEKWPWLSRSMRESTVMSTLGLSQTGEVLNIIIANDSNGGRVIRF